MFTVSKIKAQEIIEAKGLLSHTWEDTYGKYYSPEQIAKITGEWHNPEVLKKQAEEPNTYFAVAKDEAKKIVGLITVRKLDAKTAFMGRIYVHPNHQGKNIGSQLLNSALKEFGSIEKLRVECEKRNSKACAFYLKKGFRIVEEKDDEIEGVKMRSVIFEKNIR